MTVRVAVVGAGAVGCYYGGMLARAGIPVALVGRSAHVAAMRRDGLRLTSATFDERIPVTASEDIAAIAGAQLVLVCVKSTDTALTGASMASHLAPDARVLSLQNGVDNATRLQALLRQTVAPAVVYVASEMAGPGHVRHRGRGELVIASDIGRAGLVGADGAAGGAAGGAAAGVAAGAASAAALLNATLAAVDNDDDHDIGDDSDHDNPGLTSAEIVALFARAGVPVDLSDNVVGALWAKLVLNCGYNAISAITDVPYGRMVTLPGIGQTVHDVVLECLAVAQALGITIPGDIFAAVDRIPTSMPGQVSSTCQDLRRGKPTEIDHLNGTIVVEGERLGIATPLNRALYALVKALETKATA